MRNKVSAIIRTSLIAELIILFLLFDCYLPVVCDVPDSSWTSVGIGVCIGQLNLLAIWAALAPGTVMVRLPWSFLLGVLMWYAIILGCMTPNPIEHLTVPVTSSISRSEAFLLGAVLLSGIVFLQAPLWFAARVFRWKLCRGRTAAEAPGTRRSQFHVRHLMLVVSLCAVALALGRFVVPPGKVVMPGNDVLELVILLTILIVINVLITLPAICVAFAPPTRLAIFTVAWPVFCLVISFAEISVVTTFLRPTSADDTAQLVWWFFVLNLSQWLTVSGVLLVLRVLGFRLQRTNVPAEANEARLNRRANDV